MRIDMNPGRRLAASALIAAAVGAGVWLHLGAERKELAAGIEMGEVLVARKYIAAGKPVTNDLLQPRAVPRAYVEPGALIGEKELGSGGRSRVALMKGEQVTRTKIELAGSRPGLAWVVPP